MEWVDVDVFDGGQAAVPAIELASSLCFSDSNPIGGVVTGVPEAISLNKRLQQDGFMAVAFCPIVAQTFGGCGQNAGRRVPHVDPRKDQEPGVVGNAVQVAATALIVLADELVARGHFPSGRREAQGRQ